MSDCKEDFELKVLAREQSRGGAAYSTQIPEKLSVINQSNNNINTSAAKSKKRRLSVKNITNIIQDSSNDLRFSHQNGSGSDENNN